MFPKTSFGEFINENRAYRINTPTPPRELINVLQSCDGYMAEVTHWGTATASVKFPDGETNTIIEGRNKTLYCRNEDTGEVWCPGVYPMMSDVDEFSCEHHDTFTQVRSTRDGLTVTWRLFIPRRGFREIWTVTVENGTGEEKRISLVPAVMLSLTGFPTIRFFEGQGHYGTCSVRDDIGGLYFEAGNPQAGSPRYNAVLGASREIADCTGNALAFLGAPMSMRHPQALLQGGELGDLIGFTGNPFAAIRCMLSVPPGSSEVVDFVFGVVENADEATEMVREVQSHETVEQLAKDMRDDTRARRDRLSIRTPDAEIDAYVNTWLKKGLEYCLRRKDATRDNLQFADGLVMSNPDKVRKELRRILTWQLADGHTLRSWMPHDANVYGDGPLWLFLTVPGYLKFSDDLNFLGEILPFFDQGEGTVREHLERGLQWLETNRGPNGLSLIRYADWNDALSLTDPKAESVFCTMGYGFALREMAALLHYLGEDGKAEDYEKRHAELKALVNEVAWDEASGYYVRAFAGNEVFGASSSEQSKLFINPQSWAILGDMVPAERLPRLLETIDTKIEMELGCPVNIPAYDRWNQSLGRISAQLPGTGENGGIYCHATAFKIAADTLLSRGDEALRTLHSIMPDSEVNPAERSGATPYALTSSYSINGACWGRAGRSWLTGTQAWMMQAVVEGLIGVRRAYGGFHIAPALPTGWNDAQMTLKRYDQEYHFHIRRDSKKHDAPIVTINGQQIEGDLVPFQPAGTHEVVVLV